VSRRKKTTSLGVECELIALYCERGSATLVVEALGRCPIRVGGGVGVALRGLTGDRVDDPPDDPDENRNESDLRAPDSQFRG
jgi:hypothetical protein